MEKANVLANNRDLAERLRKKLNLWLNKVSAQLPKS